MNSMTKITTATATKPADTAPQASAADAAQKPSRDYKRGFGVIKSTLTRLAAQGHGAGNGPGVYRMLNDAGEVLYIGKAKALKKRIAGYTREAGLSARILRMVGETALMEITTTRTEVEALLLESNMIKTLRPRYNILLRDDKSFPYIMLTHTHEFPQLAKHRGPRKTGGRYFGPFASAGSVNRTVTELARAFMLRTCSDSVFRARSRPCLQYQIKRCTAPCVGRVSKDDYAGQVALAMKFLGGKSREVQEEFAANMDKAAAALEYEEAAQWRNRIRALTGIQAHQDINLPGDLNADIIALEIQGARSCIQVFFMRNGSNYGNKAFFPQHAEDAKPAEIIAAFIGQFYDDKPPPHEILVSTLPARRRLIADALSRRSNGHKVKISTPMRGRRLNLVSMAKRNAAEALARELAASRSQRKLLAAVQAIFGLAEIPQRIEVYDNSHIQGSHATGAMIVAGEEGFIRKAYRKYNITGDNKDGDANNTQEPDKNKDKAGGDDFAMMREVLTRRFRRAMREDPERATGVWPDLVLLDGGKGQLSSAHRVLDDLGIDDIPLVAISKGPQRNAGREQFHIKGRRSFTLPQRDPALHFLQRLRDEAHRFAIGAHRKRRAKAQTASPLDSIPGIGAVRKKSLLAHFGSAREVARAGVPDLMRAPGISRETAEVIYGWFNNV